MWLFNDLPVEQLKKKYNFQPDQAWIEHIMKSCVRFNVGGSASFVSSNGLVLTNHHVGSDTIYKLSGKDNDYLTSGFFARTFADELKAPDLELNQLVAIRDVTAEVSSAVHSEMSPNEAAEARRAAISIIEKKALDETGLRSDVVTLYGGGRYHLYQYKKYTDVRLVWAPESAIAFMGGDADNFEYPRYCLDACLFRVYENGEPAKIEHFLKWSENGPADNELVFVAGNPGRTSRIFTVDALKFQRDKLMPFTLDFIRRREVLLQQFSLGGKEHARIAKDDLFGIQNARKARMGMLQGLQDPAIMAAKERAEKQFLARIQDDPKLQKYASAWEKIAEVQRRNEARLGKGLNLTTGLFTIAQRLVQMAAEDLKPSPERLAEFGDAARQSLEQQLYSEAPIYPELEQLLLADSLARALELRGADDPICIAMLDGKSPIDRAAELIQGTKLIDVEFRKALAAGGQKAINASQDPLIRFAVRVDDDMRATRKETEELQEIERQAYAQIAEAIFATQGTTGYPDATFTLRLAFGTVKGYEQSGEQIQPWTTMGDAFKHELAHEGQDDFQLPSSWHDARDRISPATPFNFVSTADIIGGNSGSPVVNRHLELVGLIFDGNIQSLTADYQYDDRQSRAVSVHSSAIRDALRYVYDAENLANQLGN
jgi:hypothetical protein